MILRNVIMMTSPQFDRQKENSNKIHCVHFDYVDFFLLDTSQYTLQFYHQSLQITNKICSQTTNNVTKT